MDCVVVLLCWLLLLVVGYVVLVVDGMCYIVLCVEWCCVGVLCVCVVGWFVVVCWLVVGCWCMLVLVC